MNGLQGTIFLFGSFRMDAAQRALSQADQPVSLTPKEFDTLLVLVEHSGELVDKETIVSRVWPDTFVSDSSLTRNISVLRRALGDGMIETVPKFGYRFTLTVTRLPALEKDHSVQYQIAGDLSSNQKRLRRETDLSSVEDPLVSSQLGHPRGLPLRRWPLRLAASLVIVAGVLVGRLLLHRRPPHPTAELTQTRLTFVASEDPVGSNATSPDGKYLAYSDSAGIHVKVISTGDERVIPKPAGVPAGAYWGVDSWFPDGTQLLAGAVGPGAQHSIWTTSVLGQSGRELREGAKGFEVSPDGTSIVFSPLEASGDFSEVWVMGSPPGDYRELWVMGSQGDNPHRVLGLGQSESFRAVHWAPDGQRLAYTRQRHTSESDDFTLETCDLKGANRTVVLPRTDQPWITSFCWLPDGRIIYARPDSAEADESDNLWQVSVSDWTGAPIDEPKRITRWAGSYLQGLSGSADGKRLTVRKVTNQTQVYVGGLTAGGTRMNSPRRLTNGYWDLSTAWTADSKAVLFSSGPTIFKQAITQDTADPVVSGSQSRGVALPTRLSVDGAWVLYREFPNTGSGPERLMRIPPNGGVSQFVLELTKGWRNFCCARAPASLCVIGEESEDRKKYIVTAFDPLKGRGQVLRTIEKDPSVFFGGGMLSPDGTTFAFSQGGEAESHIRLLSLTGGSDREITLKSWPNISGLDWASDGKALYVGSVSPQASTLLHVDVDLQGIARMLWQFKGSGQGMFALWGVPSPDGHYLAITHGAMYSRVWMLEGF